MEVKLGQPRKPGDVNPGPVRIFRLVDERNRVIISVQVAVEHKIVPHFGNSESPIKTGVGVARDRIELLAGPREKAQQEILGRERIAAFASDCHSAPKAEFQVLEGLEVDLVSVDIGARNVAVSVEPAKETINPCGAQYFQKTRQLNVRPRQASHRARRAAVAPQERPTPPA